MLECLNFLSNTPTSELSQIPETIETDGSSEAESKHETNPNTEFALCWTSFDCCFNFALDRMINRWINDNENYRLELFINVKIIVYIKPFLLCKN